MKIIGGEFKNRKFFMHADIRPTQDLAREALFDIFGQNLEGIRFLDLFSGSGAMGLEALSRQAEFVLFVEKDDNVFRILIENLGLFPLRQSIKNKRRYEALRADAFVTIKKLAVKKEAFDIVFIDPPYGRGLAKKALKTLEAYDILHANSIVVIEHELNEHLPDRSGRFLLFRRKKYGISVFDFYKINDIDDDK
jgi:16S rRNA (guanine(966)-N(2))-methyltransferase RsmD